ncbi:hypothetical protein PIS_129 [Saccharomonospora phage PIS 136]|nr:hypothetical protein PIS_129 [Saccharomonospora phage PIS 136]
MSRVNDVRPEFASTSRITGTSRGTTRRMCATCAAALIPAR